jgi:hypothetical protein
MLSSRTAYRFILAAALVVLASVVHVALLHEYFSTVGTACLFAFGWFHAEGSVQKRARFREFMLKLKSFSHVRGKFDLQTPQ